MLQPKNPTPAVIDSSKCTQCGICVKNCPRHIFQFREGKVPRVRTDALCFDCGHCVALCPVDAVSLPSGGPSRQTALSSDWNLSVPQVEQFMKNRRSCRCYAETPPSKELLQKIIAISAYAPSGQNWPLVKWLVINDRTAVQQIARRAAKVLHILYPHLFRSGRIFSAQARKMYDSCPDYCVDLANEYKEMSEAMKEGRDTILYNAPALVITYGDPRNRMTHDACITALAYFDLAANALGLGTCWSGTLETLADLDPMFFRSFGLPRHQRIIGVMMAGYPEYPFRRIPQRRPPEIRWMP